MQHAPNVMPAKLTAVEEGYSNLLLLVEQAKSDAKEEQANQASNTSLQNNLSCVVEQWTKLERKLEEKKLKEGMFATGVLLPLELRKDYEWLDLLYAVIEQGQQDPEFPLQQDRRQALGAFIGRAKVLGEEINSAIGERKEKPQQRARKGRAPTSIMKSTLTYPFTGSDEQAPSHFAALSVPSTEPPCGSACSM